MGPHRASEMLLLNKKFTSQEAYEARLVGELFDSVETMMDKVKEVCATLSTFAPGALFAGKTVCPPLNTPFICWGQLGLLESTFSRHISCQVHSTNQRMSSSQPLHLRHRHLL